MKVLFFILALFFSCVSAFAAVNINTANKKELMSLEGIGAKKADAIIAYRESAPFSAIEDIKKVDGIGDKVFEAIKDKISISGETTIDSQSKKAK